MGGYLPSSGSERQAMLQAIGLSDTEQLYASVPEQARLRELDLPAGLSQMEAQERMESLAGQNRVFHSIFRGAGAYCHFIPPIVKRVTAKEEFLTAYTPYQAEISQGILQSIFEYQTQMCELTGMDVSNASVYDGAAAAAEAVFMCQERSRSRVILAGTLDPRVRRTVQTYCASRGVPVDVLPVRRYATDPADLAAALGDDAAAVLVQTPNYYGVIEPAQVLVEAAHTAGAKAILSVNPTSLGLLKTPGELGADIAVGEGQPLGLPLGFGGPYLGFMTCRQALMRKLPGRIVGQTVDGEGRRCFVLTLQAREQHIRREKALSNICSNEALCAMTASVYLAAMGPVGLRRAAESCSAFAHELSRRLAGLGFRLRAGDQPFFHEFLTDCPVDPGLLLRRLEEHGILGGLPVDGGLLWCCTECCGPDRIDRLVAVLEEVCKA